MSADHDPAAGNNGMSAARSMMMPVNVITLGVGKVLSATMRRATMLGLAATHTSMFREGSILDFRRAFRAPLCRESAMRMAFDLRIDMMSAEPVVFSPKSSLTFDPLHSVAGFSYSMGPSECVSLCRRSWESAVHECFGLIDSDEPAMFIVRVTRTVGAQTVYGRLAAPLLAANPRVRRSFYLMSESEQGGVARRAHGFFTLPSPSFRHIEEGASVTAPYVQMAINHFTR